MVPAVMSAAGSEPVLVVGTGLAGSLVALALADRGAAVTLIGPDLTAPRVCEGGRSSAGPGGASMTWPAATALSYGSVAGFGPAARWRRLETSHGPLGWRASAVVLHGLTPQGSTQDRPAQGVLQELRRRLPPLPAPLPLSRLDGSALALRLPLALRAAGVVRIHGRLTGLEHLGAGAWALPLADGQVLTGRRVVLAAGAGSRALLPTLPERLRCSWAGVLLQAPCRGGGRWLDAVRRGWMVFPRQLQRPGLERRGRSAGQRSWVVDVSLAPWGDGLLAGQISWLPPVEGGVRAELTPPDAAWMETQLREELGRLDPGLAALEACFHQVPVSYCSDGVPLSGPVAPGLWVLAGVSNAYSRLPALAEELAAAILERT